MRTIETKRLTLRNFEERDYEDVYEFLSQRKDDEFEAYTDITYENGREHLAYRVHNDEFIAIQLKDTGKIIGNVYLGKRDLPPESTGCSRSATRGTNAPGGFWKNWIFKGKHFLGRMCISKKTRTEIRSGRIPMSIVFWKIVAFSAEIR